MRTNAVMSGCQKFANFALQQREARCLFQSHYCRLFSTTSNCQKNIRAGQVKGTPNKNKPLTYEQSQYPYLIGVSKSWNSWNTGNLKGETAKAPLLTFEDAFIRKFMEGTWHNLFLSEVIIKRRQNIIIIAGYVKATSQRRTLYFLKGYSEELLSQYFKRPVKIELQTAGPRDLVFKYV